MVRCVLATSSSLNNHHRNGSPTDVSFLTESLFKVKIVHMPRTAANKIDEELVKT